MVALVGGGKEGAMYIPVTNSEIGRTLGTSSDWAPSMANIS